MIVATLLQDKAKDKESWRTTDLAPLAALAFSPAPALEMADVPAPLGDSAARLVFLNGAFVSALSHVEEGLFRLTATGTGVSIEVPASVCLATQPLELVFVNVAGDVPCEARTPLAIKLAAGARVTLVERFQGPGVGAPFVHVVETDVTLGAGAKLVMGKGVTGGAASYIFETMQATLAEGAFLDHVGFLAGGKLARQTLSVTLAGRRATAHLSGAMMPGQGEQTDTLTLIKHRATEGTSRQLYKTVLADKSRGVFQGRIRVEKGADKTDANQTSRALLLSDKAEMHARPELEIFADDVACSHGNTIGDLDSESLFYLQARGIDEDAARRLLVHAFLSEGIEQIATPPLRTWLAAMLDQRLNKFFEDGKEG